MLRILFYFSSIPSPEGEGVGRIRSGVWTDVERDLLPLFYQGLVFVGLSLLLLLLRLSSLLPLPPLPHNHRPPLHFPPLFDGDNTHFTFPSSSSQNMTFDTSLQGGGGQKTILATNCFHFPTTVFGDGFPPVMDGGFFGGCLKMH